MQKPSAIKLFLSFFGLVIIVCSLSTASVKTFPKPDIEVTTVKNGHHYQVKARMIVSFSPQEFLRLVDQSNKDCSWIAHCMNVNVLENKNNNEQITHTELDVTWPFNNRDMVVQNTIELSENTLSIELIDKSTHIDKRKGFVRITEVSGIWKMQKQGDGYYLLTYTGSASPNGLIPDWFASKYLADATRTTFKNIFDRLTKVTI